MPVYPGAPNSPKHVSRPNADVNYVFQPCCRPWGNWRNLDRNNIDVSRGVEYSKNGIQWQRKESRELSAFLFVGLVHPHERSKFRGSCLGRPAHELCRSE